MANPYKVGSLIYDAEIYDAMNTDLSDLPFYKKWLPKTKPSKVLELCCGTGRLSIPLAKEGLQLTGVDITASMLEQAKIKAIEAGVDINFIEADIRTLELNQTYDTIFIPFNSVHHLYKNTDLFNTLNAISKHLKPEGLFIFDVYNPDINYIAEYQKAAQRIAQFTTQDGRNVSITQHMQYESDSQINRIKWEYTINGSFHSIQHLDMRLYFPKELDAYLEQQSFTILHKFGSFTEDPFNSLSQKQIFVCRK